MRKILQVGLYLTLPLFAANGANASTTQSATSPSLAPPVSGGGDSCGARDYRYLIGKSMDEARYLSSSDYRIVSNSAVAASNPKRLTIVIDERSRIQQIVCG